jgi:iron complex transport system substrate-binding protein
METWTRFGPSSAEHMTRSIPRTALLLSIALHASACSCRPPSPPAERREGIVSLVPAATEILFALGAGDEVVGVSDYCTHPPRATELPRYGGVLDPSIEGVIGSGARAVVVGRSADRLARAAREAGMEVVEVGTGDLSEMDAAIAALGRLVERPERARELRSSIHAQIAAAARAAPPGAGRKVAVVVDRAPDALKRIFVAGGGSLPDQLLDAIGARNVFGETDRPYPMVSLETVVGRAPEVILDLRPLERDPGRGRDHAFELWRSAGILAPQGPVEAVHVLEATDYSVYGPRLGDAARELMTLIHGTRTP